MDTWTLPQTQIVIINYEKFSQKNTPQLIKDILKRKFDCVILDEAHRIKNRNAKTSINIHKLHNIPKRLCLTGTPAHDNPEDLFNIIRFLRPNTYTSYWKWLDKWFTYQTVYTSHGTVQKPAGIQPSLRRAFANELKTFCTMRKRAECMEWDTSIPIVDIPLPADKKQLKYIQELKDTYCVGKWCCLGDLDRIVRYRQICNDPGILELPGTSPKYEWVVNYIKDNPDDRIIFFSDSRMTLNRLSEVIKAPIIHGGVQAKDRQKLVDNFQAGKIQHLLLQTTACKEGLTLDRADTEVFIDVYPPSSNFSQAKDRAVATKPEHVKDRVCYRLYIAGTFDEAIVHAVDNKLSASDVVNNFKKYVGGDK